MLQLALVHVMKEKLELKAMHSNSFYKGLTNKITFYCKSLVKIDISKPPNKSKLWPNVFYSLGSHFVAKSWAQVLISLISTNLGLKFLIED